MNQNSGIDFGRRLADEIAGLPYPYTTFLAGPHGAHYHFWFPVEGEETIDELKAKARKAARRTGDPVSFSWDWRPADD